MVSEVNPDALEGHRGLIANPNCSTMQLMVALKPIHEAAGIDRLIVSTYQSVSGTGVKAVKELEDQTRAALAGEALPDPTIYPHHIAFNVLGGAGNFPDGDDHTDEERKMMFETRKILGDEIDQDRGHVRARAGPQRALGVGLARDREDLSVEEARGAAREPARADHGRRPDHPRLPDGALAARAATRSSSAACAATPRTTRGLQMWVVSDNLLKGAATNAVQIAEVLHERGLVKVPAAA